MVRTFAFCHASVLLIWCGCGVCPLTDPVIYGRLVISVSKQGMEEEMRCRSAEYLFLTSAYLCCDTVSGICIILVLYTISYHLSCCIVSHDIVSCYTVSRRVLDRNY